MLQNDCNINLCWKIFHSIQPWLNLGGGYTFSRRSMLCRKKIQKIAAAVNQIYKDVCKCLYSYLRWEEIKSGGQFSMLLKMLNIWYCPSVLCLSLLMWCSTCSNRYITHKVTQKVSVELTELVLSDNCLEVAAQLEEMSLPRSAAAAQQLFEDSWEASLARRQISSTKHPKYFKIQNNGKFRTFKLSTESWTNLLNLIQGLVKSQDVRMLFLFLGVLKKVIEQKSDTWESLNRTHHQFDETLASAVLEINVYYPILIPKQTVYMID